MKKCIAVINDLKKQGIIEDYAIGGGIAAIYYIEAILTYDLDIFLIMPTAKGKNVIDMSPLYDRLKKRLFAAKGTSCNRRCPSAVYPGR